MEGFGTLSGPYDNTGMSKPNEATSSESVEDNKIEKLKIEDYSNPKSEDSVFSVKKKIDSLRITLFIYNLVFFILSFLILSSGTYLLITENDISFSISSYLSGSILVIIIGAIILLISLFGIVSSIFPFQILLFSYTTLMLIILAIEISIGVWGFVMQNDIKIGIRTEFQFGIQSEYGNENLLYVNTINFIQDLFDCCGYYGFGDWNSSTFVNVAFNQTNLLYYPQQCCDSQHIFYNSRPFCNSSVLIAMNVPGCRNLVDKFAVGLVIGVGIIGVVLALLQTLGILLALFLICFKRHFV